MPTPDHLGVKGQAKVQPPPRGLGRALLWPLGVLGLRMRLGQSWVLGVKRGLKSHIACYFHPLPTPRFVSPPNFSSELGTTLPAYLTSPHGGWGTRLPRLVPQANTGVVLATSFPHHPLQIPKESHGLCHQAIFRIYPLLNVTYILCHLNWCGLTFYCPKPSASFLPAQKKNAEFLQGPLPSRTLPCTSPPQLPLSSHHQRLLTVPETLRLALPQGVCTCCLPCSLLGGVCAEHPLLPI